MIPETESLSMLNAISEWHIHHPIIQLQPIIFCNTKHKTKAWMTLDASPASIRAVPVGGRKKHAAPRGLGNQAMGPQKARHSTSVKSFNTWVCLKY